MVQRRERMSRAGLQRWSRKIRNRVNKYVFKTLGVQYMPLEMARDKHRFCDWLYHTWGVGTLYIYSWRMKMPKFGKKRKPTPYLLAIIEIQQQGEGYIPAFISMTRLKRERWFLDKPLVDPLHNRESFSGRSNNHREKSEDIEDEVTS